MRRGTPGAIALGIFLRTIRQSKGMTMRQVSLVLDCHAAEVSNIEKGIRALKEPKIELWAKALEVEDWVIRDEWLKYDAEEEPPIVRTRRRTIRPKELEELINDLTGPQRERVRGYIDCLLKEI
jgi:transcriptional regulator with XRE-family HTH domain